MPALRRRRNFKPSELKHGSDVWGRLDRFDLDYPLTYGARLKDTDERVDAGPPDPPVWGFKPPGREPWAFFRHEQNARQFQQSYAVARMAARS